MDFRCKLDKFFCHFRCGELDTWICNFRSFCVPIQNVGFGFDKAQMFQQNRLNDHTREASRQQEELANERWLFSEVLKSQTYGWNYFIRETINLHKINFNLTISLVEAKLLQESCNKFHDFLAGLLQLRQVFVVRFVHVGTVRCSLNVYCGLRLLLTSFS